MVASSNKDRGGLLVLNQVEIGKCQRVIPVIDETLQKKGTGQGRRGQDFCDWSQGAAGAELAEGSRSLYVPDCHFALMLQQTRISCDCRNDIALASA